MAEYSIFDIIGPVMVGPSSSHTAGANRLGYIAKHIINQEIKQVIFYLHGSFAKTYKGHGTDKALLGGILGFLPDDERIKDAFIIANKNNLIYEFIEKDLGEVHPNTALIHATTVNGKTWDIMGSSIGGGRIKITKINSMEVEFEGEYTTLLTYHTDYPGIVAKITTILAKYNINIAFMKLFRENKGCKAFLIIETDEYIDNKALLEIKNINHIYFAQVIQGVYK